MAQNSELLAKKENRSRKKLKGQQSEADAIKAVNSHLELLALARHDLSFVNETLTESLRRKLDKESFHCSEKADSLSATDVLYDIAYICCVCCDRWADGSLKAENNRLSSLGTCLQKGNPLKDFYCALKSAMTKRRELVHSMPMFPVSCDFPELPRVIRSPVQNIQNFSPSNEHASISQTSEKGVWLKLLESYDSGKTAFHSVENTQISALSKISSSPMTDHISSLQKETLIHEKMTRATLVELIQIQHTVLMLASFIKPSHTAVNAGVTHT